MIRSEITVQDCGCISFPAEIISAMRMGPRAKLLVEADVTKGSLTMTVLAGSVSEASSLCSTGS